METITKRKPGRPHKVEKLTQINGKVEKDFSQISTLDEAWGGGVNPLSAYGTISEESYTAQLRQMNHSELENHARQKGVMFTNNLDGARSHERLRDLLLKEFRTYVASLNRPVHKTSDSDLSDKVRRILASK